MLLAVTPRLYACIYIPLRSLYLQYFAAPDQAGLDEIEKNIKYNENIKWGSVQEAFNEIETA